VASAAGGLVGGQEDMIIDVALDLAAACDTAYRDFRLPEMDEFNRALEWCEPSVLDDRQGFRWAALDLAR
jgi:hypothetical protein